MKTRFTKVQNIEEFAYSISWIKRRGRLLGRLISTACKYSNVDVPKQANIINNNINIFILL